MFRRKKAGGERKHRAWTNSLHILFVIGGLLAVVIFQALTAMNTRQVKQELSETFEFMKRQLNKYENYVVGDRTKSLVRLLDKTQELARVLGAEPDFGVDGLEQYAYDQQLDGILVVDSGLNTVMQTEKDGDIRAKWKDIIENANVSNIIAYPTKNYATRTTLNGIEYDLAVTARKDGRGLVVAYAERRSLTVDSEELTLTNLFTGFKFDMGGVVAVTDGVHVLSTNSEILMNLTEGEAISLSDTPYQHGQNGLVRMSCKGRVWYGNEAEYNGYKLYAFFPSASIFATRTIVLSVTMAVFFFIWMGFVVLQTSYEQNLMKQSQRRLNIINAIGVAYSSMYLAHLSEDRLECILNKQTQPDGGRLSTLKMHDAMQEFAMKYVVDQQSESVAKFFDLSTIKKRLEKKQYVASTFESINGEWYYTTIVPQHRNEKGEIDAVLIATRNYTEDKKRELEHQRQLREAVAQARRADAAKTDFLRRMSHDIRTPINGIRGMVEISRHYAGDEKKQEDCRKKIMAASGFLLDLVNNVLDMNKLESGEILLNKKPFDICSLVEETVAVIEGQTGEKSLTLHKEVVPVEHDHVIGSPLHVRQILQNILGNAVHYNKVGGDIFLTVREASCDGETVRYEFTIRDTGVGMSREFQKRAFEPFAQENSSARSSYTGTGLGLAIVKELVEKMGGTIDLSSVKGEGTTFVITLPFAIDNDVQEEEHEEAGDCSIDGVRVLLVEDNDLNMEIAEFTLKNAGTVVTEAKNGKEALDLFAASKPGDYDVILMDMMMPVMDGLEATRRIRALNRPDAKAIPIFAMTANAFSDDVERSKRAGINEHLTKPLDGGLLIRTIFKYLRK